MKLNIAGLTDLGSVRSVNQDAYFIDPNGYFLVLADGMGGHAGGQEASQIAIQSIHCCLQEHWHGDHTSHQLLTKAITKANDDILENQRHYPQRADMGTTVVVVIFLQGENWCAHIGDSRLYRLRSHHLTQITEDHTWVNWAAKSGLIQPEETRTHPMRHVLSQCLGRENVTGLDIQPFDFQLWDRLLVCSDGLTEELTDDLIAVYLASDGTNDHIAQSLINAANERGGGDNITVVIVSPQLDK